MRITDLNPHGGIGANSLFVELGPFKVLVDAGMSPKHEGNEAIPRLDLIDREPLDLILLTHCHLDHLGAMPVALRNHPNVPLVMTPASRVIAQRMLHNSHNVMVRQREENGVRDYPLYRRQEIEQMTGRIFPLAPDNPRFFSSLDGDTMTLTYHHAGHIPGAAGFTLEYHHRKIFFTGDVLFDDMQTLPGATFPREQVDTLVLETTRGASGRPPGYSRDKEVGQLVQAIRETLEGGGSVLLPTFALGRMQEVFSIIHRSMGQRQLPRVPVFASGLGVDLCDYFDQIARKTKAVDFRRQILKDLKVQRLPHGYKPGQRLPGPAIYVLSSGMMVEHTPSYIAAVNLLGDARNLVAFVGYCDPDTPGGLLQQAAEGEYFLFEVLDKRAMLAARRMRFDLSGHADRDELLAFALDLEPRAVVLTHGDPEARDWFADQLRTARPKMQILDPTPLEPVEV
ncbi:MAG: beta-lactamase domain-containing protein [Puniceicoccaceae bacterium 5H]|nr:MAG: beta-lactamase domain-containing protein [Puniceicoccaceae bacterium 5H]